MHRLATAFAISGLLISALPMSAQAKTKTVIGAVTIKGTASAPTPGPCSAGYANQCLGSTPATSCECIVIPNASATGGVLGKGGWTADLSITVDKDARTTSSGPGCQPAFASATLTNSKTGDTATLNISATGCDPATVKGTGLGPILGGFGIESASNGATGFGTVTGTHGKTTGLVTLMLKGPITTP